METDDVGDITGRCEHLVRALFLTRGTRNTDARVAKGRKAGKKNEMTLAVEQREKQR